MTRIKKGGGFVWTQAEDDLIREKYPTTTSGELAVELDRTASSILRRANVLGVHKAKRQPWNTGRKGQMPKGWGAWSIGRFDRFQKGHLAPHTKPIGEEKLIRGRLYRKVGNNGSPNLNWRPVTELEWVKHFGPVPEGHVIRVRDGDPRNVAPHNLEAIHRRDVAAQNSVWSLPREIAELYHLTGTLKRAINRKGKKA